MTSTLFSRTQTARRIAAACGVGVLLLGASACGSDPAPASQTSSNEGGSSDQGSNDQQTQQGQRPGANGKVAAVADDTAQVQSSDSGQVAVTWTSSTTFTKQVSAELADISVGDCVMVTSADTGTTSGGTSQPPTQPTEVTATSVRISEPVDGSCTPTGGPGGGGPGGTGGGPSFQANGNGQPPAGAQGGTPPSGAPQMRGSGGAVGTVKSVSGNTVVVGSTRFAAPTDGSSTPTQESVDVTVTVTATTTYTATAKGSASDVKVGQCVQATGEADDTGAVTATRIAVTPPVDGECGGMFRRSTQAAS